MLSSCNKEDLRWNLPRNDSDTAKCKNENNNCESLSGITTFADPKFVNDSPQWKVGSGFIGNGYALTEYSFGGHIEFTANLSQTTKIAFWTKARNTGPATGFPPTVTINGKISNTSKIKGSEFFDPYWIQLETQNIPPGNHVVRLTFPRNPYNYFYYIDEIEFRCQ
jgi:hypothetical protein